MIDGDVWIGSLASERGWVRNLRATGRGDLDFGGGPRSVEFEWCSDPIDVGRYRAAVNRKHWILGPLLQRVVKGAQCAFRVKAQAAPVEASRPPSGGGAVAGSRSVR